MELKTETAEGKTDIPELQLKLLEEEMKTTLGKPADADAAAVAATATAAGSRGTEIRTVLLLSASPSASIIRCFRVIHRSPLFAGFGLVELLLLTLQRT